MQVKRLLIAALAVVGMSLFGQAASAGAISHERRSSHRTSGI